MRYARVTSSATSLFGGSDIVMVFQDEGIVLDAEVGTKYLQGQRVGYVE